MNVLESPCDFSRFWAPLALTFDRERDSTQPAPVLSGESDCLALRQGGEVFRARWTGGHGVFRLLLEPALRIFIKLGGGYGLSLEGDLFVGHERSPAMLIGRPVPAVHSLTLSLASAPEQNNELLVLTLPQAWFEDGGLPLEKWPAGLLIADPDPSLRGKMQGLFAWMDRLAEPFPSLRLRVEALVLSLVADVIEQCGARNSAAWPAADLSRLQMLKEFLDSGAADGMQLADIARHAGCNVSTLQSRFRNAFGKTIGEYLRESRLLRVAERIEKEGISLSLAAELAGYGSQANFSTAFRRCFGVSPGQVKAGVVKLGDTWKLS